MYIAKLKKNIIIKSLNIINFIIEKNPILPILKNFIIIKKNTNIYFLANNLDIQIKIIIDSLIKNNYISVGISLKNFLNIIKTFPEGEITLKINKNNKLTINYNKIKFFLNTIISVNYPKIKKKKFYKTKINIQQKIFLDLINFIYFAMDMQNNNYSINGMLLRIKNNNIKAVTTDNYRLAYYKTNEANINNKINKIIIPNKTILLLKNLLAKENKGGLDIDISKNQIKFKFNNIEILSKLIEGKFPKLENKIYNKYKNNFIINRKILQSALKRSLSIIKENFYLTRWIVKDNILKIITKNNSEKGNEEIIIKNNGSNINIFLNIKYIIDLINNINIEEIQFNFSKKFENIIIMIPDNNKFKYIMTPVNT